MPVSPAAAAIGPVTVSISSDGDKIPDRFEILEVYTSTGFDEIAFASVTFVDGGAATGTFSAADSFLFDPGRRLVISAAYGSNRPRVLFEGMITGAVLRINDDEIAIDVDAKADAFKLDGPPRNKQFLNARDSEIIEALASEKGLKTDIETTNAVAESRLQIGSNDWDFANDLARHNGQVLLCEGDTVRTFTPDLSSEAELQVTLGVDILSFRGNLNTDALFSKARGVAWDSKTQSRLTGESSRFERIKWGKDDPKKLANRHGATVAEFESANDTADALKARAETLTRLSSLTALTGHCSFQGSALAKPGGMLELNGVSKRFSGRALISGVTHRIEEGTWTTGVNLGRSEWPSDELAQESKVQGLRIGKVLQTHEDPDAAQRIKVSFPTIGEDGASVWARMAAPYASDDAGVQFLPEVGDEVVVGFMSGAPDAPVILGALHNGKAKRPAEASELNLKKIIKTKSGLSLSFDDELVITTLETPGGHKLVLDDEEKRIALEDSNGNRIVLDQSGIAVSSPKDLTLSSDGDATIASERGLKQSAKNSFTATGQNIDLKADVDLRADGASSATLISSGEAIIAGSIVKIN